MARSVSRRDTLARPSVLLPALAVGAASTAGYALLCALPAVAAQDESNGFFDRLIAACVALAMLPFLLFGITSVILLHGGVGRPRPVALMSAGGLLAAFATGFTTMLGMLLTGVVCAVCIWIQLLVRRIS